MQVRRIKASTIDPAKNATVAARIVLCELKENSSKYATWLECFPTNEKSYFIYGGYFQNENDALRSFVERMPTYKVENDRKFIPDTEFFEI